MILAETMRFSLSKQIISLFFAVAHFLEWKLVLCSQVLDSINILNESISFQTKHLNNFKKIATKVTKIECSTSLDHCKLIGCRIYPLNRKEYQISAFCDSKSIYPDALVCKLTIYKFYIFLKHFYFSST